MKTKSGTYQVSLIEDKQYVLAVLTGKHDRHSIGEVVGVVRKLSLDEGALHALYDLSKSIVTLQVGNAYFFPRQMQNDYLHLPTNKIAVITSPSRDQQFWKFYETTAKNAGLDLRTFCSYEEAESWISQS